MHYASYYGLIDKYYALINMGCNIEVTHKGNNLLHYACISGHDDFLVIELVKLGINPLDKNSFGETSFHLSSNEKISHYLNVWAIRNKINIAYLVDENLNTVAHTSKSYGHVNGLYYWLKEYPELDTKANVFNKTWKECKRKKISYCQY